MSLILKTIKNHDPSRLALIGDTKSYSYGELQSEIDKRSEALLGVSVLGLALDNGTEWVLWDLAAVKANIPCVPIPPFFTSEQVNHVVKEAGVSHLLLEEGLKETGFISKKTLLAGTDKITFTSGTTGAPKGVCLSQEGLEQVAQSIVTVLGDKLADKHLSVLPMAILLENIAGIYATLLAGGTVYAPSLKTIGFSNPFQPNFSVLSKYMDDQKITSVILVPELLRGLMSVNPNLPALKFLAVGGSKIAPTLISTAQNMGLPVYEGYGLSECGSVVALNTPNASKVGGVGKLLPHIQLTEDSGEIVIQNPAFLGYLGKIQKGCFATGDLGALDQEGFLYIDGRKKNIIITSYGRNISPEWIRSVLIAQPEILDAKIYGDAQPTLSAEIVPRLKNKNIVQAVERANSELPDYAQIKDFKITTKENDDELLQKTG